MAIRMIEYDFLIALKHAGREGYEYTVEYPDSCVLYLRHNEATPDYLTVHVKFPEGVAADYRTSVIKVKKYGFELRDNHEITDYDFAELEELTPVYNF